MHEPPEDYRIPEQFPLMLEATTELSPTVTIEGAPPYRRIRDTSPFVREFAISDAPPSRTPEERSKFILWRPVKAKAIPEGWVRSPFEISVVRATGFTHVGPQYASRWSQNARHLLKRLPAKDIRIEEVTFSSYRAALPTGGKFRSIYAFMTWKAGRFDRIYGSAMHWYLAYNKESAAVSGLGVLMLPEQNFSFHVSAFTDRRYDEPEANVGLIDRWHRDALARGISYIDFGSLWRPGDPKSWKGFADFKKKFGVQLVHLPQTYITFVPSRALAASLSRLTRLFPYRPRARRASR